MIGELVRTLREGGHTLVVANGAQIRTFDRRGVADLHALLTDGGEFLHGATVADKVVGKAAAALMLLGGVSEMHTEVISRPALDLLAGSGMRVGYEVGVPHVSNRDKALASRPWNLRTARECLERIEEFLQQQQIGTTNESK